MGQLVLQNLEDPNLQANRWIHSLQVGLDIREAQYLQAIRDNLPDLAFRVVHLDLVCQLGLEAQ